MATLCFGKSVNGNAGHDATDILYIAFTGDDAVPGAKAKWNAANVDEFSSSIKSLGDTLVQRIGGTGGAAAGAGASIPSATTIKGSKASDPPTTLITAKSLAPTATGEASVPASEPTSEPTTGTCEWTGHCAGKFPMFSLKLKNI